MSTTEQRLADLEREVAELKASLRRVAVQATALMTLEEIFPGRRQVGPGPAAPSGRPRHLQAVQGGRR
jgi:hypothetical protein